MYDRNSSGASLSAQGVTARVSIPADFNVDDVVNTLDLAILAANFEASGKEWITGDATGDGVVDTLDLSVLAANFSVTASTSLALSSPSEVASFDTPGNASFDSHDSIITQALQPQVLTRDLFDILLEIDFEIGVVELLANGFSFLGVSRAELFPFETLALVTEPYSQSHDLMVDAPIGDSFDANLFSDKPIQST
ncbi:MAG: dockerin type I domain-containing protein [Planctomycetota bacterium]